MNLDGATIMALSPEMLMAKQTLDAVYDIASPSERARVIAMLTLRSKELRIKGMFADVIAAYNNEIARLENEYTQKRAKETGVLLKYGADGKPLNQIANFTAILNGDRRFESIRYNLLSGSPEVAEDGKTRAWTDADDAKAREYIEEKYALYHQKKYEDAMRGLLKDREYHPVKEIIEEIEWDGTARIDTMLAKWMKCEDTKYTREVSRLIFACGIHRVYEPGCKVEDVPILIGKKQGEGKTTFVNWLAMKDEFFSSVKDIEGPRGVEALSGVWIAEFGELLALTKTKEVEAVKDYISRRVDKYRAPYDKHVTDRPRQCIFIGTTNREQFLTDKSGNRRYYPVHVNQIGYELFNSEKECKADIMQCWAEAKVLYDRGEIPPYAARELIPQIREQQSRAEEDDYREGMIAEYLEYKTEVCIIELWQKALKNDVIKPTKKDCNDIGQILSTRFAGEWERANKTKRVPEYGVQKIWRRTNEPVFREIESTDELPF